MFKHSTIHAVITLLLMISASPEGYGQSISRDGLVQDVRELARIFETAHPDPYEGGGGKIAFHRRLQKVIAAIPDRGMTRTEFYRLVCPFVAALGDGHTSLASPYNLSTRSPGGLPLYFMVVEDQLYVGGVTRPGDSGLLGALLLSVEGLPLEELIRRQKRMRGCDCDLHALNRLAYYGSLWYGDFLEQLIPEWKDKRHIHCELRDPGGNRLEKLLEIPDKVSFPLIKPETRFELPSIDRCDFVYEFIDEEKSTAILRIDKMSTYRECFELDEALGFEKRPRLALKLHLRYNRIPMLNGVIAGIPSATEVFLNLVSEMKAAGTKRLIIDIRRNGGGYSLMSDILLFFLYGQERLLDYWRNDPNYEITKYSDLYFANYKNASIEEINRGRPFPLAKNDYDFSRESGQGQPIDEATLRSGMDRWAARTPSFYKVYQSEQDIVVYAPEQVLVVCSPNTYSSGYGLLYRLYRAGATLVGTPSAQGGNAYGDLLAFKLENSKLNGWVSKDYIVHFPEDPEMGRILEPHHPLTYEKLKSYDFDPNAEILLALEVSSTSEGKGDG